MKNIETVQDDGQWKYKATNYQKARCLQTPPLQHRFIKNIVSFKESSLQALLKPPFSSTPSSPLQAPFKPFSSPLQAPFKPFSSPLQALFKPSFLTLTFKPPSNPSKHKKNCSPDKTVQDRPRRLTRNTYKHMKIWSNIIGRRGAYKHMPLQHRFMKKKTYLSKHLHTQLYDTSLKNKPHCIPAKTVQDDGQEP